MASAHLETANEQQDFGLLLGPATSWMATLEHQRDLDMVMCVSEHWSLCLQMMLLPVPVHLGL